jgi:hypothetical protein
MTTQEIANRLVEICRAGQFDDAYKELFADNAKSIEPNESFGPKVTEGLTNLLKKAEGFNSRVEAYHGITISDAVIAGDYFSISLAMDLKMHGRERGIIQEICVYHVQDGKIDSEQFFF